MAVLSTIGVGHDTLATRDLPTTGAIRDVNHECYPIGIDVVLLSANDTRQVWG